MNKEKSCGGVVYVVEEKQILYLVLKQQLGHFSFAKGHVEKAESEEQTALREIKEETGLDVELNTDFRIINTYKPMRGILKDVIYFAAKAKTKKVIVQKSEIDSFTWLPYQQAIDLLTFDHDKVILLKADEFIRDYEQIND